MCDLMDLLAEIPDTTIAISQQETDTLISVPKRGEEPYRYRPILPDALPGAILLPTLFPQSARRKKRNVRGSSGRRS